MFILLKKKTLIIIAVIIAAAVTFCCVVFTLSTESEAAPKNGKVIVIDAGHGGIDGGVEGATTKVKESDINLAITRSLKHFLISKGYTVVLTRSTTDGLYGMATKNRKMRDMEARKTIINDARPDLVVSIHQNSYPRSLEKGAQVFYAPKSENGESAAKVMQEILRVNLDTHRIAKTGDYYILQCSPYLSMIVECGFLTNPTEEKLLVSATYQEKIAYTIFTGIHAILYPEIQDASAH